MLKFQIKRGSPHHALAEVVGVHALQRAHEQRQHVGAALRVVLAGGHQAPRHADHAAERGGEGVGLRQGLHRRVRSAQVTCESGGRVAFQPR